MSAAERVRLAAADVLEADRALGALFLLRRSLQLAAGQAGARQRSVRVLHPALHQPLLVPVVCLLRLERGSHATVERQCS